MILNNTCSNIGSPTGEPSYFKKIINQAILLNPLQMVLQEEEQKVLVQK